MAHTSLFNYHSCRNGVQLRLAEHVCRVAFISPGVCNVRYAFADRFGGPSSGAVLIVNEKEDGGFITDEQQLAPPVDFTIREEGDLLVLETLLLTVRISRDPFALSIFGADGRALHRDVASIAYAIDSNQRRFHRFQLDGYSHFYGFGDKGGKLNKLMRRVRMYSCDAMGYNAEWQDPLYKHIPFFIKYNPETKAFCGVFYDNPASGALDIGCEKSNYWPAYGYFTCDAGDLDYYVIAGKTPAEVLDRYTGLTGKTAMPPLSSLGSVASTMYFTELDENADTAIDKFVACLHEKNYGCDWYHLSSGYTSIDNRRYIFNWDKKRFPEPGRFVENLRQKGVYVSPNIKPAMLLDHPLYSEFADNGAFILNKTTGTPYICRFWGGEASFIDFTRPEARALWAKHLNRQLVAAGITDFWLDNNEYEIDSADAVCSLEDGALPAEQIKPVFANLMCKTTQRAMAEIQPNHRTYLLTRAGYAGIQRYAQTWTGDNFTSWNSLRYNILQILSLGLSGVANQGSDIGGFSGPAPDGELFVRWVQNGIFQPRFCIHSCNTDNTVTLPWSYPEYEPILQAAFHLRYRLLYYFYSLFRVAATTGAPLMRPTFYDFPDDPQCFEHSFDFMCGPALLVANVLEPGAASRSVYLPKGTVWYDWQTHRSYEGGQTVTVDVSMESIPLFYRAGAIVPLVSPAITASPGAVDSLRLLVAMADQAQFTLYQDDGHTNEYLSGVFHETRIDVCRDGRLIRISFRKSGQYRDRLRQQEIQFTGVDLCPLRVIAGGRELPVYQSRDNYNSTKEDAFYYNMQTKQSWIKYNNPSGDYDLVIDFGRKDLVGI